MYVLYQQNGNASSINYETNVKYKYEHAVLTSEILKVRVVLRSLPLPAIWFVSFVTTVLIKVVTSMRGSATEFRFSPWTVTSVPPLSASSSQQSIYLFAFKSPLVDRRMSVNSDLLFTHAEIRLCYMAHLNLTVTNSDFVR